MKLLLLTIQFLLCSLSVAFASESDWTYFRDSSGLETHESILTQEFTPFVAEFNFGNNGGVYWLKARTGDKNDVIGLNSPHLGDVACYVDGKEVFKPSNALFPYYSIGIHQTAYIKVNFSREAHIHVQSYKQKDYLNELQLSIAINSFYYGCVLMVILLHFIYYFTFKDITFLLYVMAVVSLSFHLVANDGMLSYFIKDCDIMDIIHLISGNLGVAASCFFAYKFLDLNRHAPKLRYLYLGLLSLMVILTIMFIISNNLNFWIGANAIGMSLVLMSLIMSIYLWKKNDYAKFYTIANAALILFGINFFVNPLIGINDFGNSGAFLKAAGIWEMTIFTYALIYRMKALKRENSDMERSIYDYVVQTESLENELEKLKKGEKNKITASDLTPREVEILTLIAEGKSNKEIGNDLNISVNTVKYHTKKLYDRLDINSRQEVRKKLSSWSSDAV